MTLPVLAEVIRRRFRDAASGANNLPDLVMIDGGKGRVVGGCRRAEGDQSAARFKGCQFGKAARRNLSAGRIRTVTHRC